MGDTRQMSTKSRLSLVTIASMLCLLLAGINAKAQQHKDLQTGKADRAYWASTLYKISWPVVKAIGKGTLRDELPLEAGPGYSLKLQSVTYLEAVGRTLAGLAPWLELPDDNTNEGLWRKQIKQELMRGLPNLVNPVHPDCLNFKTEMQPLVDAAFLAHAFLRAPRSLWQPLDSVTKKRFVSAFQSLRDRQAYKNNWVLFAGITEAFLLHVNEAYDTSRMGLALRNLQHWYVGDGMYADGEHFAMDYYNAYVMHPMLTDMLYVMQMHGVIATNEDYALAIKRMQRYAVLQERMISPEGTFPVIGRSITYRTGAFQALSQVALQHNLPASLTPGQVRSALTTVMHRVFDAPDNFDKNGWLQLGLAGHQPQLADTYTSTGSLYLTTLGFLALGLPASDDFWTAPAQPWSTKKAFSGEQLPKDYKVNY